MAATARGHALSSSAAGDGGDAHRRRGRGRGRRILRRAAGAGRARRHDGRARRAPRRHAQAAAWSCAPPSRASRSRPSGPSRRPPGCRPRTAVLLCVKSFDTETAVAGLGASSGRRHAGPVTPERRRQRGEDRRRARAGPGAGRRRLCLRRDRGAGRDRPPLRRPDRARRARRPAHATRRGAARCAGRRRRPRRALRRHPADALGEVSDDQRPGRDDGPHALPDRRHPRHAGDLAHVPGDRRGAGRRGTRGGRARCRATRSTRR